MITDEVREKYLKFFEGKGHIRIDAAPLVLKDDSSTLFTSSGMQPLVPYLMGEKHAKGKRLVNSQPSIRVQDIEEVGDNRHTTFFEMLGNWSLGDYFKKEQLPWIWEFMTSELGLKKENLYVSVFEGNDLVPRDKESYDNWISLGVPKNHIFEYGVKKNWWSRSGTPDQMPEDEIGGPDSEIFFDFGENYQVHEKSQWKDEKCHPNCDCGRFLEIGNSVFIQYKKKKDGTLEELPQKNVDFGGGLERLVAATKNHPDVFWGDSFWRIIERVQDISNIKYIERPIDYRVIADHIKAAVFLIENGVKPSNKQQGYVLRRLLRRLIIKVKSLKTNEDYVYQDIIREVILIYKDIYFQDPDLQVINEIVDEEIEKFNLALEKGEKLIDKVKPFDLYQTYGIPTEITEELYKQKGLKLAREELEQEIEKHKNLSRSSSTLFKAQKETS